MNRESHTDGLRLGSMSSVFACHFLQGVNDESSRAIPLELSSFLCRKVRPRQKGN